MNYAEQIQMLLKEQNSTQEMLARDLNVTFATVNRWLNGKAVPRKNAQTKIAHLLEMKTKKLPTNDDARYEAYVLDISQLDTVILSETELKRIAQLAIEKHDGRAFVQSLLEDVPNYGRYFDWNCGSILQHFDSELVIDCLKKLENLPRYHSSIGLAWLLGEFNRKDQFILNFLQDTIRYSSNFEASWRAAFSLENLRVEEAIVILKRAIKIDAEKSVEHYIDHIRDKKSIIAILLKSNTENIQTTIYPKIKETFLRSKDTTELINCCWLIGRLNIIDEQIVQKISRNLNTSNYELKYYTYFALQNNTNEVLRPFFEKALHDEDPLIRKMACRAIRKLGNEKSLIFLERLLLDETDFNVVTEVSRAIYCIKNPRLKMNAILNIESNSNENGMISDESDKWYKDASIYNAFSEYEDPQSVCFDLISAYLAKKGIRALNPIDLATGTGRYLLQIRKKIAYSGTLYGVDASADMCGFIEKKIRREKLFTSDIKIVHSLIKDIGSKIPEKSNFIVSSFGFPSKISNKENSMKELRAVYDQLSDDGVFITVGWDETFNDELNYAWYKYIPDFIQARDFEDWRRKKSAQIKSARNCGLTWFKKGLSIPLQFPSLSESVRVMGYLFGRDAAKSVIRHEQTNWNMAMGITIDTKHSLKLLLDAYERN